MSDQASASFSCFGGIVTLHVSGRGPRGSADDALAWARTQLLQWHERFSRFEPGSELSQLNRDPRGRVPVSPLLARLGACVRGAGSLSGGLVDGTLLDAVVEAGYASDIQQPLPLARALALAPPRTPARPSSRPGWREIEVDLGLSTITRPAGVRIDSGGLAKGLFADVLAEDLAGHGAFAVGCAGDFAIGGRDGAPRAVDVASPFDGSTLHTFEISSGGVATSGIGRRAWLDGAGRPAHHLLDPATGRPAFTGIVQVTALADTALGAETRAKAALLSGPRGALQWLPDGGVIVLDDGSHHVLAPPPVVSLSELQGFAHSGHTGAREDR
jgi:thiamine biosynthesis lipoprotein